MSELVDLVVVLAVLPLLVAMWRKTRVLQLGPWWLGGYVLVVLAYVFTIAEGVGGPVGEWLNVMEHAALLGAGTVFARFALALARDSAGGGR